MKSAALLLLLLTSVITATLAQDSEKFKASHFQPYKYDGQSKVFVPVGNGSSSTQSVFIFKKGVMEHQAGEDAGGDVYTLDKGKVVKNDSVSGTEYMAKNSMGADNIVFRFISTRTRQQYISIMVPGSEPAMFRYTVTREK